MVDAVFGAVSDWNKDAHPDTRHYVQRINSYFGFLIHSATYAIRWRVWRGIKDKSEIYCSNMKKLVINKKKVKLVQTEEDGILTAEWTQNKEEYELCKNNDREG